MAHYQPPFHMTDKIVTRIAEISEQLGRITVLQERTISPHLRRENRIRTSIPPLPLSTIPFPWNR